MSELTSKTIADLRDGFRGGEFSAREIAEAFNAAVASARSLNAYTVETPEDALAAADAADKARGSGDLPPLAGIPLGIKDLFATRGVDTTAGSRILKQFKPPYESTVVANLRKAGAGMLGKLNMDEFAMGSSTENSGFFTTCNPWDLARVPGGSSGGASAVVAADMAPLTLGTDTGGSIRQPAAVTGTVGAKPTYGGVSRYGLIAFSSSLDQAGPCARTVLDAALLHSVIGGHDPRDSTSIDAAVPDVVGAARDGDVSGMTIGVVTEFKGDGYQPGVLARFDEAVALLEKAGARVEEVSCPHFDYALPAYYLIAPSEASSNLARYDAMRYGLRTGDDELRSAEEVMALTREAGFGDEVKRRIILGTYALSAGYYDAYYGQAQKVRTLISRDFTAAFERVDVLVSVTTPTTAFRLGERVEDPMAMYLADLCTIPSNLYGGPALSVPCGLSADDGLPVGFQVMAPVQADDRMYRVGAAIERALGTDRLLEQAPSL